MEPTVIRTMACYVLMEAIKDLKRILLRSTRRERSVTKKSMKKKTMTSIKNTRGKTRKRRRSGCGSSSQLSQSSLHRTKRT